MLWRSRKGYVVLMDGEFVVLDHFGAIVEQHWKRHHYKVFGTPHFLVTFVNEGELRQRSGPVSWHGFDAKTEVLELDLVEDDSVETGETLRTLTGIELPVNPLIPVPRAEPVRRPVREEPTARDYPPVVDEFQRHFERRVTRAVELPRSLTRYSKRDSLAHLGRDVEHAKQELMERKGALPERLLELLLTIALEYPSEAALTAYVRACLLFMKKAAPDVDETWVPVAAPQLASQVVKLVDELDEHGATAAADAMETCSVLLGLRGTWGS